MIDQDHLHFHAVVKWRIRGVTSLRKACTDNHSMATVWLSVKGTPPGFMESRITPVRKPRPDGGCGGHEDKPIGPR